MFKYCVFLRISMDSKKLKDLIEDYSYGQFNILNNGLSVLYNLRTREVQLDPFYRYDARPKTGNCVELMNTAYLEIRNEYPDLHVTRVIGKEPTFFRNSIHCALFVSEQDLMNGEYYMHESKDIEKVLEKNPLLVDPSFKTVVPFSKSGYKVHRLYNQGCRLLHSNTPVLSHNLAAPLGISKQGYLVYLMANLDVPGALVMGLRSASSSFAQYSLGDDVLFETLNKDSNMLSFLDLLKKIERFESKEEFQAKQDIVIE